MVDFQVNYILVQDKRDKSNVPHYKRIAKRRKVTALISKAKLS